MASSVVLPGNSMDGEPGGLQSYRVIKKSDWLSTTNTHTHTYYTYNRLYGRIIRQSIHIHSI